MTGILCEVFVNATVGHCPKEGAVVRFDKDAPHSAIVLCVGHGETAFRDMVSLSLGEYAEAYGWADRESPIIGGRITPA